MTDPWAKITEVHVSEAECAKGEFYYWLTTNVGPIYAKWGWNYKPQRVIFVDPLDAVAFKLRFEL